MATQMPSRLYRSRSHKMIAGVSGGLGEYFDVDPVLIRLLFVVTAFISGAGIVAYIVLWIVVPLQGDQSPRLDSLRREFDDLSGRVREHIDPRGGPSRPAPTTDPTTAPTTAPSGVAENVAAAGEPVAATPASPDLTVAAAGTSGATTSEADLADNLDLTDDLDRFSSRSEPTTGGEAASPRSPFPGAPPYAPEAPYAHAASYAVPEPDPDPSYTDPAAGLGATSSLTVDRRRRRQHWAGAILILIGVLVLGNNLGLLWWARPAYVLPLILVGVGAWLLFGRARRG